MREGEAAAASPRPELPRPQHFSTVDGRPEQEQGLLVATLDLLAQAPGIRRLKAWASESLDAQPGMTAVDVGCGTGEDTQGLALAVAPGGLALGVDVSAVMVGEARRRAAALGSAAQFERAAADALPLDDARVDVVRCERTLQHVPDPLACVDELRRVLRPGGRVALLDTDWRTLAVWPGDPRIVGGVRDAWAGRVVNPAAGAQLLDLLVRAGFEDPVVIAEALVLRPSGAADRPPLTLMAAAAVDDGVLSQSDVDAWRAQVRDASARGGLFGSVLMVGAAARAPR